MSSMNFRMGEYGALARICARKICGSGMCVAQFEDCIRPESLKYPDLPFGEGDKCPLGKYKVADKDRINGYPTEEELLSACRMCEHASRDSEGRLFIEDEPFEKYCMDCPVNMALDNVHEAAAEAAMSF